MAFKTFEYSLYFIIYLKAYLAPIMSEKFFYNFASL